MKRAAMMMVGLMVACVSGGESGWPGHGGAAGSGGDGSFGGHDDAGSGGSTVQVEAGCIVAPAGICGPLQPPYGWVCPGDDPPHPTCYTPPAQAPVPDARTWCCAEPCAPHPGKDSSCPDGQGYFVCYEDAAAMAGCEPHGETAVCCG